MLGLNTDTERHPTAAARDWIGRLAPLIAQALDPMRSAVTFLCPFAADGPHSVRRITVLGCGGHPPGHLRGIVVVSPPGDTQGLDQRELEILGLLIDDWSDQRIAAALDLPTRTVAESVERILAKLNAPTRIVATLRALRRGLYTPRALIPDRA
ncbi:LuxR C-terminal-related transcriptional regulator [Actinoplanes sp. KI2]|uniref:helix-turn-helix transcriptional regulator n=1 Tax=Actinoplanes sp. KI2 TaxID=2983315 RepID=UPI0021D5B8B4|nr:LuxR C-terminal-related transcriptional regulator [Actinoplanes sp. KI2]MCU7728404.1 LuxR C-terminal-related transcriptional regulator [Actinoplanes sp. KI2]